MVEINNIIAKAGILVESLPYIRRFAGKTFVIKYGGHAMVSEELKQKVIVDIILLKYIGINPLLVHGGGNEINSWLKKLGIESCFAGGLRVTDAPTMELAEMVLSGKINRNIVGLINKNGGHAVGISGRDANLMIARRLPLRKVMNGNREETVDLGFVGEIEEVNPHLLNTLTQQDYIPVVSSIAANPETGEALNINADTAAGELAAALQAEKLILLTDVEAIMSDPNGDRSKRIPSINRATALEMIEDGRISSGMIPKVEACLKALNGGVARTHIIDGRVEHSLLLEIFTDQGIGTMVIND